MKKQPRKFLGGGTRSVFILSLVFAGMAGLLFYKLASLTNGISGSELRTFQDSAGWRSILTNPLFAPLTVIERLLRYLPFFGTWTLRFPVALYALASLAMTYAALKRMHGPRTALFGVILLGTSAFFLHVGRSASYDVLYLAAIPATMLAYRCLADHRDDDRFYGVRLIIHGALLYVPGMLWLVLSNVAFQHKDILSKWRQMTLLRRYGFALLIVLMVSPLATAFVRDTSLIQTWLGLPEVFDGPARVLLEIVMVPVHLLLSGQHDPGLWLGRLPVLNALTAIVFLAGMYFYGRHWRAQGSRLLLCYAVVCTVLIALNGPVRFSVVVPIALIVAAAGMTYVLHEWFAIFPRNTLARGIGIAIVIVTLCVSAMYESRHYFIAWPHSNETRQTFTHHL